MNHIVRLFFCCCVFFSTKNVLSQVRETKPSHRLMVSGDKIVNQRADTIVLRGVGLGGMLHMENFINGFPGNEEAFRETLKESMGEEKYEYLFEKIYENYFTAEDATYISSLGLNLVRIPINYRLFENDMDPGVIKMEAFQHLDRVIDLCAKNKIYTIIDLHALPGYQNQDWHSDNPTHVALFWKHRHFQDRVVKLWETIARRYRENDWVAGYDLINEPADPTAKQVVPFYKRLYQAVRTVDPAHILFLEGNRYAQDFHMFDTKWDNVVFTNHDYAEPGFITGGPYPGVTNGRIYNADTLHADFLRRSAFMIDNNVPVWVGEFGPVYTGNREKDNMRFDILSDQLSIYDEYDVSWCLWLYKDIGLQGIVHQKPATAWMQLLKPVLMKKARLGVDAWGGLDTEIRDVMRPIEDLFTREFPEYDPFPFGSNWNINRIVRHILFSEPLLNEVGELFRDLTYQEIEKLGESFHFRNCKKRSRLSEILLHSQSSSK